ncbi:hypothetical protein NGM37_37080, partial [Streptomyces sp. TRM76130]|nr:hypothetical protein [Streptomyces sp. TRM76130]
MSTPNVADITERIRQQLAAAEDEDQGEQRQTSEEAAVEHFEERVNGMLAEMLDTGDLDSIPPLEPVVADMLFRD